MKEHQVAASVARRDDALPAVHLEDINKTYGVTRALEDVSMAIGPGQVHGLVGRNGAGKSTLLRIMTGMTAPDRGKITLVGAAAPPIHAREEWQRLVACVYQRPSVFYNLSVAENICVNRYPSSKGRLVPWGRMRKRAARVLAEWGVDVDPTKLLGEIPLEQRQLVQIARALDSGSRIVLLDEPTVQLERAAIDRLFAKIRQMRTKGVTFIYVSHFLSEITDVCDWATVLRDGRHLWTERIHDISERDLLEAIMAGSQGRQQRTEDSAGATIDDAVPAEGGAAPVLEVDSLTDLRGAFRDVSFTVRPGELVAIAGLGGSGKNALGEAISGLRRAASGTVQVDGRMLVRASVSAATKLGVAFVPADRHAAGFVADLDVAENITMSAMGTMSTGGFFSPRRRAARARDVIGQVSLVPADPYKRVADLSGGNQQKVVLGRALATDPRVLVLLAPTAGVDVAAKDTIYAHIRSALAKGIGIVIISDDIEEILISKRVLVMRQGQVVADLVKPTEEQIVRAMEQGMEAA